MPNSLDTVSWRTIVSILQFFRGSIIREQDLSSFHQKYRPISSVFGIAVCLSHRKCADYRQVNTVTCVGLKSYLRKMNNR